MNASSLPIYRQFSVRIKRLCIMVDLDIGRCEMMRTRTYPEWASDAGLDGIFGSRLRTDLRQGKTGLFRVGKTNLRKNKERTACSKPVSFHKGIRNTYKTAPSASRFSEGY